VGPDGLRNFQGPGGLLLPSGRQTRESRCLRNYNQYGSARNRWKGMGFWIPHFCVSGAIVYDGCKLTRHRPSNKMAAEETATERSRREGERKAGRKRKKSNSSGERM